MGAKADENQLDESTAAVPFLGAVSGGRTAIPVDTFDVVIHAYG